jgi:phenylacetate-CoA ligase
MNEVRAKRTRELWLATLEKFRYDADRPANADMWSPRLDAVSRDERFGILPSDIRSVDDLHKWPVVDKAEMMADAEEYPPYGTYTTVDESVWARRGWMMFSSSGSTGAPASSAIRTPIAKLGRGLMRERFTPWGFGPARRSS